jgi:tetratricopeptide (TPR) repeat protein
VDERERLARQTARNLQGLELERAGRSPEALALYEENVAEGFEGDWPYGRLVAAYERDGDLAAAERVLERAIEVFSASRRRTPADRRATVRAFKGRLRLVKRATAARDRASRRRTPVS